MRISADQTIAGYPAVRIRQLIREAARASITLRHVRQVLRCSDSGAASVVNRLLKDGLIESVCGRLEPSTKGIALAMATAARPLRRTTAARLVADLIERARAVNADNSWAYRVGTIAVFGSYVLGADRPSDVDVACEVRPRWKSKRQQTQEQVRRENRGKPFRNISEWATWPKLEVFRFLRARTRGLSIHELDDWILQNTDHQVVFKDDPKAMENGCRRISQAQHKPGFETEGVPERLPPEQKVGGSNHFMHRHRPRRPRQNRCEDGYGKMLPIVPTLLENAAYGRMKQGPARRVMSLK